MIKHFVALTLLVLVVVLVLAATAIAAQPGPDRWPAPVAPAIADAFGYVAIPHAPLPPDSKRAYRAIFDAQFGVDDPTKPLNVLNMVGAVLNALSAVHAPAHKSRFVIVFHDDAIDGILDETHYKAKFGVSNPNLKLLDELKRAGVELFVCGQNLSFAHIDPHTLTPLVAIASSAVFVLMSYQNDGYALMTY